jgi:multidrug efflux pump subunit AcrB
MSRFEAAWRSPTELAVPVLAATLTIVASFMPLAYLPGAPGEFIRAMSFTVAIALMVSFAVAMLLTPMLALTLVKTGLHQPAATTSCQRCTPLDAAQSAYERAMNTAMPRKRLTMVGAGRVGRRSRADAPQVPYRFFPMNERPAHRRLMDASWNATAGTDEVLRRLTPCDASRTCSVHHLPAAALRVSTTITTLNRPRRTSASY